jgi:hypothetical protein
MTHRFKIGQIVELRSSIHKTGAVGPYEIRSLVPASDSEPRDPRYRIKSTAEKWERVAPETELSSGIFG